jgi:hypothetical protein
VHKKLSGDIGIGQTRWNFGQTNGEGGNDQLRNESEEASQWVKMGKEVSWTLRKENGPF